MRSYTVVIISDMTMAKVGWGREGVEGAPFPSCRDFFQTNETQRKSSRRDGYLFPD